MITTYQENTMGLISDMGEFSYYLLGLKCKRTVPALVKKGLISGSKTSRLKLTDLGKKMYADICWKRIGANAG
jgi:hypothetical protein